MPDIFTKRKRSEVMAAVRSRGNQATELRLIQVFRANGITGWRRGRSLALGNRGERQEASGLRVRSTGRVRPDFVFPELPPSPGLRRTGKIAVFVDGCFWHGCPRHATWPKTRAAFWRAKIEGNRARDGRVNSALRKRGWKVIHVWQHELRRRDEAKLVRRLMRILGRST